MSTSESSTTVVVLGSINMDLVATAERMPAPGETVMGERFGTAPGGKGANQAVACARLGVRVRMVGRVGQDAFGPVLLASLQSEGIDTSGVAEDADNASGVAMIMVDGRGQNHILAVYGANWACGDAQLEAAKHALTGAQALLLQHEIPPEVSMAAARHARSLGATVVWDPAPARDLPPEAYAVMDVLTDVLTPNQTEAEHLTGIRVTDVDSAQAAARALLERGAPAAVVKLGEQGACFATPGGSGYVPPFRVKAVDTVAAGDAFGGGLAVALSEGRSLEEAVRFGSAAGALAVTRAGAQGAMPYRREVEALLAVSQGPLTSA